MYARVRACVCVRVCVCKETSCFLCVQNKLILLRPLLDLHIIICYMIRSTIFLLTRYISIRSYKFYIKIDLPFFPFNVLLFVSHTMETHFSPHFHSYILPQTNISVFLLLFTVGTCGHPLTLLFTHELSVLISLEKDG